MCVNTAKLIAPTVSRAVMKFKPAFALATSRLDELLVLLNTFKSTAMELCGGKAGLGLLDSVGFLSQAASPSITQARATDNFFLIKRFMINPPEKFFSNELTSRNESILVPKKIIGDWICPAVFIELNGRTSLELEKLGVKFGNGVLALQQRPNLLTDAIFVFRT
ncbi:MAG: hypothetical protein ALAOOOJD_03743 [bacterium]|nr:hypothetical protein [bacterium]